MPSSSIANVQAALNATSNVPRQADVNVARRHQPPLVRIYVYTQYTQVSDMSSFLLLLIQFHYFLYCTRLTDIMIAYFTES